MYFNKIRHPSNVAFAHACNNGALAIGAKTVQATVRDVGEDVFHVELTDTTRWPLDARVLPMHEDAFVKGNSRCRLGVSGTGNLVLSGVAGEPLLSGAGGCPAWVCVAVPGWCSLPAMPICVFFGQGEKTTGLEKSGLRTKFWNSDVWADHAMHTIEHGQADPQYVSIPYLLMRHGDIWVGLLVDHPGAAFMDTGSNWFFFGKDDPERTCVFLAGWGQRGLLPSM
jgi:alpha-glucosidase